MRDPDLFDTFYKDARERLLLQTYALTGDLAASRAAVRDSFIVAWHHWRKVSALDDPEESVRPQAWRHAQRRHTARLWHRDKDIDPEVRATLDALAKLTITQRRALLLTQLAKVTMPQMAREIGLPLDDAERELRDGGDPVLAPPRGARVRDPLRLRAAGRRWSRTPAGRAARSSAARARPGGVPTRRWGPSPPLAAVVVTGSMVTDAAGVRPEPRPRSSHAGRATQEPSCDRRVGLADPGGDGGRVGGRARPSAAAAGTRHRQQLRRQRAGHPVPAGALRRPRRHGRAGADVRVRADQAGTDQVGDPGHRAVRHGSAPLGEPSPPRSGGTPAAQVERTQLVSTRRVKSARRPGDAGRAPRLRRPADHHRGRRRAHRVGSRPPPRPWSATTAAPEHRGQHRPAGLRRVRAVHAARGRRVRRQSPGATGGAAAGRQGPGHAHRARPAARLPRSTGRGSAPSLGGPPRNLAATRCDQASFSGKFKKAAFAANMTRTFLIPEAKLPAEFGLTETVATLPREAGQGVRRGGAPAAGQLRGRGRQLGTEVDQVADFDDGHISLTAWRVTVQVSDKRSVRLHDGDHAPRHRRRPALLRARRRRWRCPTAAFVDLAYRALDRLVEMPKPEKSD